MIVSRQSVTYTVDPQAVQFIFERPDGQTLTLTYGVDAAVGRDGLGQYHADMPAPMPGLYMFQWNATGQVAVSGQFNAVASLTAPENAQFVIVPARSPIAGAILGTRTCRPGYVQIGSPQTQHPVLGLGGAGGALGHINARPGLLRLGTKG